MNKAALFFLVLMAGVTVVFADSADNYDLAKLVKSGVSEDVILAYINASATAFVLTSDEIVELKALGASDNVIAAAIRKNKPAAVVDTNVEPAAVVDTNATKAAPADSTSHKTKVIIVRRTDTVVTYRTVPPSGRWVYIGNLWYWEYPTGATVYLGWQPDYFYPTPQFRHFGGWGRGGHRLR
jgi:glucan-binding YG repeat protein